MEQGSRSVESEQRVREEERHGTRVKDFMQEPNKYFSPVPWYQLHQLID